VVVQKNKSICFFTNSMFKIGGEQRITSIVTNGLIKCGYKVTIIVKHKEKIDYELYGLSRKIDLIFLNNNYDFRLNNLKIFELLRNINRKHGTFKNNKIIMRQFFCSNQMIKELKTIFKNNKFNVVVGVAGDRSFILSYLKKYIDSKLVFWNHQSIDAHFKKTGTRYFNEELFIKPLIQKFDKIVVLTNDDKEKLDNYYSIKCKVIPNCKTFISKEKTSLSNKRFLGVGRLVNQKGFDLLIKSMKMFSKGNDSWILDIYGDGELNNFLIELVKKYKLEKRINIYPSNSKIIDIYLNHDIYLMSSRYEGFGLVTLEALECGLPVIGYDIPANKEIIKNNVTGILVKQFDVKLFSEAMIELANDKTKIKQMQKSIENSIKKFDEDKILDIWIKLLNKLLNDQE